MANAGSDNFQEGREQLDLVRERELYAHSVQMVREGRGRYGLGEGHRLEICVLHRYAVSQRCLRIEASVVLSSPAGDIVIQLAGLNMSRRYNRPSEDIRLPCGG